MTEDMFKTSDVLKVIGNTMKLGSFTDMNGNELSFTQEIKDMIYKNFDGAVPLRLTHEDETGGGYVYKLIDSEADTLAAESFMFDKTRKEKAIEGGFTNYSPEISILRTPEGKIVDAKLVGMALTGRPGIEGTSVEPMTVYFSETKEEVDLEDDTPIETEKPKKAKGKKAPVAKKPEEPKEPTITEVEYEEIKLKFEEFKAQSATELEALTQEISTLKDKLTAYETENAELLNNDINEVISELKNLGFNTPENIAAELDAKSRFTVLTDIKKNYVTSTPVQSGGDIDIKEKVEPKGEDPVQARMKQLGYKKE